MSRAKLSEGSGLSRRVLTAMKARGVNAAQLSERTGLSEGYLSSLLRGMKGADKSTVVFLAMVLQVNREWLAHGEGEMTPDDVAPEPPAELAELPTVAHLREFIHADLSFDPFTGLPGGRGARERFREELAQAEQKLEAYARDLMLALERRREQLIEEARSPKGSR